MHLGGLNKLKNRSFFTGHFPFLLFSSSFLSCNLSGKGKTISVEWPEKKKEEKEILCLWKIVFSIYWQFHYWKTDVKYLESVRREKKRRNVKGEGGGKREMGGEHAKALFEKWRRRKFCRIILKQGWFTSEPPFNINIRGMNCRLALIFSKEDVKKGFEDLRQFDFFFFPFYFSS